MNHLRELLDCTDAEVHFDENMPASTRSMTMGMARTAGEEAMAFFVGDIEHVTSLAVIPELCALPFRACWFEAELYPPGLLGGVMHAGMLIYEHPDRTYGLVGLSFSRLNKHWAFDGAVHAMQLSQEKMQVHAGCKEGRQATITMTYAVKAFLSALHCSNVRRQEHVPDAKLQKARAKRGKAPLFSYWTLQLDGKTERGDDHGGTHSSPRVHLRRGHPRQYVPGKWTWVQAHAVGNRRAGMVHKDYRAGPAMVAAAR